MLIHAEKERFSAALSKANAVLERKSARPILEYVLLEAREDSLRIHATDLRVTLTQDIPATVEKSGACALPGKKLFEIVREMPPGTIDMELQENQWITISAEKSLFHLPAQDPDEYPTTASPPESFLSAPASVFREMLDKTLFCASNDETRAYLCGVFMNSRSDDDGKTVLRMVSTDGHRLSLVDRPLDDTLSVFEEGIILPKKGLLSLKGLMDEEHESFLLAYDDGKVFARFDGTDIALTRVDGSFPRYQDVIPAQTANRVVVRKAEFTDALRRVSLVSDPETHSVILETQDDTVIITAMNPQMGDAREELEGRPEGNPIRIAFNATYFLDALRHLDGEDVEVAIDEDLSPCLIRSPQDPGYLCVVMPIRID